MKIRLTTKTTLGSTGNTKGKLYRYIVASLPKELLESANLRPVDPISRRFDGKRVFFFYDPVNGREYKHGEIGLNQDNLPYELQPDGAEAFVDYEIVGNELAITIPDELLVIKRGFDMLNMFRGFKA